MNPKQFARIALWLIVIGSVAIWAGKEFRKSKTYAEAAGRTVVAESLPAVEGPQVVMSYFLLGKRCTTCRKIESITKATAEQDFADDLSSHRLVFRTIDTGEPGNRHYLKDYQLTTKAVVISLRIGGREMEWMDMEDVWNLVDDESAFRAYLAAQIRKYLGT